MNLAKKVRVDCEVERHFRLGNSLQDFIPHVRRAYILTHAHFDELVHSLHAAFFNFEDNLGLVLNNAWATFIANALILFEHNARATSFFSPVSARTRELVTVLLDPIIVRSEVHQAINGHVKDH